MSLLYIPLSVRVRSWTSSLFSEAEFHELLTFDERQIMDTVSHKEKHFSFDMANVSTFSHSIHNALLEYLNIGLVASSGASKHLIKVLHHEYEILNLKNIVRTLISNKFENDIFYICEYTKELTIDKLASVRSFNELSALLQGTAYQTFLSALAQSQEEKNSLYWEVALDNYFVSILHNLTRRLDLDGKKAVKKMLIEPIVRQRLVSLYRYKFHYGVESVDALKYMPNLTTIINTAEWTQLARMESAETFYLYLVNKKYISKDTPNNASAIQKDFNKQLEKTCYKLLHKDLTSLSSFLAFIQLKTIQYKKITTILESKIMQIHSSDVMQFL